MNDSLNPTFLTPHDLGSARLLRLLGGEERCRIDEPYTVTLRFFDSFDWRLHAAGLALLALQTPQGRVLRLKPLDGGEPVAVETVEADPAWPADLPGGVLRERVAALLDMRVLLQQAAVELQISEVVLLNEDGKTVVRMQWLKMTCSAQEVAEPRTLWPRVRLVPVKGYDEELADVARFFHDEQEWPRAPECLIDEVMTALGREAGDYSSKLDVPMRGDEMAVEALRRILLTLLDTLERNVSGTRRNLDSEFLHDLRVATRRTRSALAQVKRVLPDAVVEDFKQRFAWLGQVTGPTRDLDVFLLDMPAYRASLPEPMREGLAPLERRLRERHRAEQAGLAEALDSPRFHALLTDWRALLEAEALPGEPGWFADLPVERVAAKRIWRMYKRVRSDGRAALDNARPEALHELRKDCKKLRYLIEFFRAVFPGEEIRQAVKTLKTLLDNLGEFQDKQVQAEHLRGLAAELDPADPQTLPATLAIGALVADLLRGQQAAHERFASCFAGFDAAENHARYKTLFKARAGITE